jgi:hypothetical protein
MSADITSVQTRTMAQHFPIRSGQPDIQFTVQFRSIDDKHAFQSFVRDHQRNGQNADYSTTLTTNDSGMVVLFWPQRGITNWKGYITSLQVQEVRFEYAPRITFGVTLVTSMLSDRTYNSSRGNDLLLGIISQQIGPYIAFPGDDFLQPPSPPSAGQRQQNTTDQQNNGETVSPFYDWPGVNAPS